MNVLPNVVAAVSNAMFQSVEIPLSVETKQNKKGMKCKGSHHAMQNISQKH